MAPMHAASVIGPALGLLTDEPHSHGFFSVFRKSGQGAAAGVIGLNGVTAISAPVGTIVVPPVVANASPAPPHLDLSSLEGLLAALFNGTFNAPLQIMAALILFLSAGRCVARIVGLGAVMVGYVAYTQGLRWEDVYPLLHSLGDRTAAAWRAFMKTPAAAHAPGL